MSVDPIPWVITSMKKCNNAKSQMLSSTNILLDFVSAYNIEMEVHIKRKQRVSLCGVPSFLVEAFAWLETNDAWDTPGIFRREGNSLRMKNAWRMFCGNAPIPADFTVHDVCTLVKRFFREIKLPIFNDSQRTILKFVETITDERILLESILTLIEKLVLSHRSTLGFLMRQLKKATDHSSENHMNITNVATIFAPSLFRDDTIRPCSAKKKRAESKDHMMNYMRVQNELQVAAVKLLIQYSNIIGLPIGEIPLRKIVSQNNEQEAMLSPKSHRKMPGTSPVATSTPKSAARLHERSSSMATPTRTNQENFFALENKLGQQSKRSPSISLMSIPFLRDRSTSVCRKQVATVNANPSIFRRIERSPSANRLMAIGKRHLSNLSRPLNLMRESCSTLVETSSKLEDPRLPIADSSPISRGRTQHKNTPTPVAHSTPTKINTGTTTDQRHSSNLFGTPIRGSSKIPVRTPRLPSCGFATPTKTPLLVSRVPNRGGPASEIKTTFHFHGTDRGQPTDYRSPLKFSLSTPTKGEPSEEAFSHSNAIFNQIVNSKSAQDVNNPHMRSISCTRPSIAQFKNNNPGYVRQLAKQFGKVSGQTGGKENYNANKTAMEKF